MKKTLGATKYCASAEIRVLPFSEKYTFILPEGYTSVVKKRDEVVLGDVIASTSSGLCLYSSCNGVVDTAGESEITILAKEDISKEAPIPTIFTTLKTEERIQTISQYAGVKLWNTPSSLRVCLINALNTDVAPTQAMSTLFAKEKEVLEAGVKELQELYPSAELCLVLPRGEEYPLGGIDHTHIDKAYPYTLHSIVKNTIEGEDALGVLTISLQDVWNIGMVAQKGLPRTCSIVVVNDTIVKVPAGYPIISLLEHLSIPLESIGGAVINGIMNGTPVCSLGEGMLPNIFSLHTFKEEEIPAVEEDPCISCGACTAICPRDLRVHVLNIYAEKSMFEDCVFEDLALCVECGMCDYVCLAKRPIMQYLRNAKENTKTLLPMG